MSDPMEAAVGFDNYGWKQVPGSPLEVAAFYDRAFVFHFRWNYEAATEWFQKMIDDNIGHIAYALRAYNGDYGG